MYDTPAAGAVAVSRLACCCSHVYHALQMKQVPAACVEARLPIFLQWAQAYGAGVRPTALSTHQCCICEGPASSDAPALIQHTRSARDLNVLSQMFTYNLRPATGVRTELVTVSLLGVRSMLSWVQLQVNGQLPDCASTIYICCYC
jgi:hypothetical protein